MHSNIFYKYLIIVFYIAILFIPNQSIAQKIDSFNAEAKAILKNNNEAALTRLSTLVKRNKGDADTIQIEVFEAAYDYSLSLNEDTLSYYLALYIGTEFYGDVRLEKASLYAEKAIEIAHNEGSKFAPYNLLGLIYLSVNDYKTALDYFFKSIEAAAILDNGSEAYALGNIGHIYFETKDMDNSIKYTRKTIPFSEKMASPDREYNLTFDYIRMANAYSEKNVIDSSEYYFGLAKTLLEGDNSAEIHPSAYDAYYSIIISFYAKQKQFDKVKILLDKAEKYVTVNILEYIIPKIQYKLYQKNYSAAYDLLQSINKEEDYTIPQQEELCEINIEYYTAIGDLNKVIEYQQQRYELQEKKFGEDRLQLISFAGTKYETIQKENEIQFLKVKQSSQQNRQLFLLFSLIALLILAGAIIFAYTQLQKRNQLLKADLENKALIEEQAEKLRQLDKVKSRFFANISHELRTPLTLLLGPINSVLNNKRLEYKETHLLHIAKKSGQQLHSMINQILDLTKIEANKLALHEKEIAVFDWFTVLTATFKSLATYNNISYQVENELNEKDIILVDEYKLSIVLKNLLSNAFKFSSEGGEVQIKGQIADEQIQFIVQDNGRGIYSQDLPYIFDRYFQSNMPNALVEGGTGIGLAITKEFTTLMGGTVHVESVWDQGSTFTVQIPNKVVGQVTEETKMESMVNQQAATVITKSFDTTQQNILIVEDNQDISTYLQTILSSFYNIETASNGMEAIKLISRNKENVFQPDLIISDIMMPIMDGYQLVERLKSSDKFGQIPIIMLTARSSSPDKLKALRIGVDDYLLKPFDEEELLIRIENLLENNKVRKEFLQNITENIEKASLVSSAASDETKQGLPTIEITPKHPNTKNQEEMEWLDALKDQIKASIGNFNLTTSQLAFDMSLSNSQLLRKTKALTGLTTKQFLKEVRLQESRKLLEERTYSTVKAVAYSVGFKDEKNFSRNFKKRFGKNPSSYLE